MVGTGKSTIARTVARKYYKQNRLGASFFFSRGGGDVSHAGRFFTSIAVQLAKRSSALKSYICKAIAEHNDIANQALRDQWNQLVLRPLSKLEADSLHSSLILVIDALDECEGENDVRQIIQLLAVKSVETIRFRFLVTSRPETSIRLGFRDVPKILHHDLALHDISRDIVDRDISIFFRHELGKIRDECDDPPADWPGEHNIDLLVQRAEGSFIYAATVCRFIRGDGQWPPQDLLELLISDDTTSGSLNRECGEIPHKSPTWELDEIYIQILKHSFRKVVDEQAMLQLAGTFRQVIGSIVTLFEPLSATALATLLAVRKETINLRLQRLRSVLDVPRSQESPIRLLHPSFCDFLLDEQKCRDEHFWVDEKKAHETLAESCLRLMSENLKRDICDLRAPGALASKIDNSWVKQCLPADLQYACRYWVQHLQRSKVRLCDNSQVHTFLWDHLLHWLEALSLIGKTSDSVGMVTALQSMVVSGLMSQLRQYRY
jgi:hypothetical protein